MNGGARLVLLCVCVAGGATHAADPSPVPSPTNLLASATPTTAALPQMKSPVESFRQLLMASPDERAHLLVTRPPDIRKRILAKVREYQSLRADQRELRLRATELRFFLLPLMSVAPADRAASLAVIPEETRKLVESRLEEWDQLSPAAQKELLDNEATIRYFTDPETSTEEQKQQVLAGLSPARREKLQAGIQNWQALPEAERQKRVDRFQQFFTFKKSEQEKILGTLSETERAQIEKTLARFEKLSPIQRSLCIHSFQKFASLDLEERQQFLKNAEKWKTMTPDERQSWRDLVNRLSAHAPNVPPPLPPRLPPRPPHVPPGASVATNQ